MKQYKLKIHGKDYEVAVSPAEDNKLTVNVNGKDYQVEVKNTPAEEKPTVAAPTKRPTIVEKAVSQPVSTTGKVIKSPLPGVILTLEVTPGQAVKRGQRIAVIEAMKMENDILAEIDGTIAEIYVHQGDSVLEGANILKIE